MKKKIKGNLSILPAPFDWKWQILTTCRKINRRILSTPESFNKFLNKEIRLQAAFTLTLLEMGSILEEVLEALENDRTLLITKINPFFKLRKCPFYIAPTKPITDCLPIDDAIYFNIQESLRLGLFMIEMEFEKILTSYQTTAILEKK